MIPGLQWGRVAKDAETLLGALTKYIFHASMGPRREGRGNLPEPDQDDSETR